MRTSSSLIVIAFLFASLAACRHDSTKPSIRQGDPIAVRPRKPAPLPPLSSELAAALEGRTIFIDPGHGGPFTGMVAPSNGIHEADVNLSVALKLRDRLKVHGAVVLMSRVDDSVPVPDNLSRDLARRAAMSNEAQPDAFISIHHNADVEAGSQKDDLEVYYKRGDNFASLDLGRSLISALGRGIRFDASRKLLLPGNYKVLRENEAPSLLIETAYLTNSHDAANLATDRGTDDEANSILYGLAAYFALDPPIAFEEDTITVITSPQPQVFDLLFSHGLPIDIDTVSVQLKGADAGATIAATDEGFEWLLAGPLPNGDFIYDITGRNMKGAGFHVRRLVRIERPVATVSVTQHPPVAGPGNRVLFAVRVLDSVQMPVADGTPVTLNGRHERATTAGGIANLYFNSDEIPESFSIAAGNIVEHVRPILGDQQFLTMSIYDSVTSDPVTNAIVTAVGNTVIVTNAEGWIALPRDAGPYRVRKNGYADTSISVMGNGHAIAALVAQHGGNMLGRRIAIDPAHGGRVPGVMAPDGSRASDLNLDVARRLLRLIEHSGAEAMLTRTGDDEITDLQRINATEPFAADLLLTISFGAPVEQTRPLDSDGHIRRDLTAFVGHYPESVNGIRAANAIAGELGLQTTACISYMVQQSQSAAVHVQPASLDHRARDDAPFDAPALRKVAESIHRGLVAYFTELDLER